MKCLSIVHIGFEEYAASEIEETLKTKTSIAPSVVMFESSEEGLARLCYKAQGIQRAMHLLKHFTIKDDFEEETLKNLNGLDFSFIKGKTFKVECQHLGEHDFTAMDMEAIVGEVICGETKAKVSMSNPDIIILVHINEDKCYIGIDYAGFDLSKRDYKIYSHPAALNGSVAYLLLRAGGWKPGKVILDPMCGSGTMAIEAALAFIGKSPQFYRKEKLAFSKLMKFDFGKYDQMTSDSKGEDTGIFASDNVMAFVKSAKHNAKIADVDKFMTCTKNDIEWLETKFDEHSVDCIVTHPPTQTRYAKDIEKLYKELFYQAEYILKKKGLVTVILQTNPELSPDKFSLKKEFSVFQGRQEMFVKIFSMK